VQDDVQMFVSIIRFYTRKSPANELDKIEQWMHNPATAVNCSWWMCNVRAPHMTPETDACLTLWVGRAIAQAVSRWLPTATARVKWDLWWTKWRWGMFSPSTQVSPANLHSTNFIIIITRGRYNRPFSGRRAEWTQLGHQPPLCEIKKK
jgi:hypothetical protein